MQHLLLKQTAALQQPNDFPVFDPSYFLTFLFSSLSICRTSPPPVEVTRAVAESLAAEVEQWMSEAVADALAVR